MGTARDAANNKGAERDVHSNVWVLLGMLASVHAPDSSISWVKSMRVMGREYMRTTEASGASSTWWMVSYKSRTVVVVCTDNHTVPRVEDTTKKKDPHPSRCTRA